MQYATVQDVQDRLTQELTPEQQSVCEYMLQDAALIIDSVAPNASADAKKTVSCRMVSRIFGAAQDYPVGATQGSLSGLGYSQSWTISGGSGGNGELYMTKTDRRMLGVGNTIGSRSPLEYMESATT